MSLFFPRKISLVSLTLLLAACGGGDGTNVTATANPQAGAGDQLLPYPPVVVGNVAVAPADGATVSGIVRLEVQGYKMSNVELLPAQGYSPKYGIFNVYDGYEFEPEQAWLDLDTSTLPNGPITVRISGFDAPAGQSGNEHVMMSARTWNINNAVPPGPLSASVTTAPASGAVVSGITRLEVQGSGLANVELLPASGYTPKLGTFNISEDRTRAWLDFDSRSIPDGVSNVRISAFNVTQGQPGAQEVVAMPARQWNLQNGSTSAFTARVSAAPLHGSTVSGTVHLEVLGTGLENVELLPATGYSPKIASFKLSVDKTRAYLDLDPSLLPEGENEVRISAFNKPPGASGAREIIAMPARVWNIKR